MAHTALLQPLFCLQLQSGQTAWERLPRKADITVTEGAIVVHQRLFLADSWVHLPLVVRAGEQFRVAASEWVEMQAMGAARVHCVVALAWWQTGWFGRALRLMQPTVVAS